MKSERLMAALEKGQVEYEVLHHELDFMARETAEDTQTPGAAFAKSVVLEAGDRHALAVIPAPEHVDLAKAAEAMGVPETHLATEDTMTTLFPDCDLGAEPPFGNLYGLPVFIDPALADVPEITFNGGTHTEAVRMRYADYSRLVNPTVVPLTT